MDQLKTKGWFHVVCRNPDGSIAWEEKFPNGTTTAGLNHMLSVVLASGTQVTDWRMGLIDDSGYTAVSASDTMSSHSGWSEFTSYSEGSRPAWTAGAVSGGVVNGSAAVSFTMSADADLRGAFLVSNSTKGGTTGTLWATGVFGSVQSVLNGQVVDVTYGCSATGA